MGGKSPNRVLSPACLAPERGEGENEKDEKKRRKFIGRGALRGFFNTDRRLAKKKRRVGGGGRKDGGRGGCWWGEKDTWFGVQAVFSRTRDHRH